MLEGRIALVTGSSHGIGEAVARELARQRAWVAVHGRDAQAARQVASEIRDNGGTAVALSADVTSAEDLDTLREGIEDALGPVDVLVANAGGNLAAPAPLEEIAEPDWRATIDANLLATFLTVKCFLPGMKRAGNGAIITIASSAGRRADARTPIPYAAAKAGIALLTQALAVQVGPIGIRANCIAPDTILTPRNRERIPEAVQAQLAALHPLQRLGTPQDVADAAAFLASDAAAWITGHVLDISGGAVMT